MHWIKAPISIVSLVGKFAYLLPMIFYKRRQGMRAFEKQLKLNGLSEDQIDWLSASYKDLVDWQKWIRK